MTGQRFEISETRHGPEKSSRLAGVILAVASLTGLMPGSAWAWPDLIAKYRSVPSPGSVPVNFSINLRIENIGNQSSPSNQCIEVSFDTGTSALDITRVGTSFFGDLCDSGKAGYDGRGCWIESNRRLKCTLDPLPNQRGYFHTIEIGLRKDGRGGFAMKTVVDPNNRIRENRDTNVFVYPIVL
jgi:hypothetical protein